MHHGPWPQEVRKHSADKTKPALIIKMDALCSAICRYYYPIVVSIALEKRRGHRVWLGFG